MWKWFKNKEISETFSPKPSQSISKNELMTFFRNCQKASVIKWEMPNNRMRINIGTYDFNNYVLFTEEKFQLKVSQCRCDGWKFGIYIENIRVYENEWVHEIPPKMKEYVFMMIDKHILTFNQRCITNDLQGSYDKHHELRELNQKKREMEEHEKEKKRLLEIFNQYN